MRYNLKHPIGLNEYKQECNRLIAIGAIVEQKEVKQTRTTLQNSAIWLWFKLVAIELNEIGFFNQLDSIITGETMQIEWNKDSIHDVLWIPLQFAAFGTTSTTKLITNQISPIYDTINEWLASKGVHVPFPDKSLLINSNIK